MRTTKLRRSGRAGLFLLWAAGVTAVVLGGASCDEEAAPRRLGGCAESTRSGAGDPWVDCVEAFEPDSEAAFGHEEVPEIVLGPPGGVMDVATLGCRGSIVVYFDDPGIVDGPGIDLIVFENPFDPSFPEPGVVAVSDDGLDWHEFPCDPVSLVGCAGVTPTLATPASGLDPTDPVVAGGDGFDLAAAGIDRARYLRVVDRSEDHWAPQGFDDCDPGQGGAGGFDLDAIAVVHEEPQ